MLWWTCRGSLSRNQTMFAKQDRVPFAVIFDNDGVLADSEHYSELAYKTALAEQGVCMRADDGERFCGLTDADIIAEMRVSYGVALDLDQFVTRKRDLYFEAAAGGMHAFPGALELVRSLQQLGIPYALASSAPREKIEFNLIETGLKPFFDHVVCGEDFLRGKPDPEIFLTAAKCIGAAPRCCVVIEDSINGLKAARTAGMAGVGIATTFAADRLVPYADAVFANLAELNVDVLRRLVTQHG